MQSNIDYLAHELVLVLEMGVEKQMKNSIKYSPFRLFYSLFKKKNPRLIENVRQILRQDIAQNLGQIPKFDVNLFANQNSLTDSGRLLRKRSYNIGIKIIKKMSVKMAFRAFRHPDLQQKIYNFILKGISKKAEEIIGDY